MKMKRILCIVSAFAALAFVGCQKEEETAKDSVQLTPDSAIVDYLPCTAETTVTSSGAWILEGDYTWVTPSATSGKSGDKVTFSCGTNTTGKNRAALFKFRCGSEYANFGIRQESGVINLTASIETVSTESGKYVFKLNVVSEKDIDKFVGWGLRWSTDPEKLITEGTDIVIEGAPKTGETTVTVEDFQDGFTYWFAGWLKMADDSRIWTDGKVSVLIKATFDSAITVKDVKAYQATFCYEVKFPVVETGVCLDELEENLTYDDAITYIYKHEGEVPGGTAVEVNPLHCSIVGCEPDESFSLSPEVTYYVRAYAKDSDGEISYGPVATFTTKESPLNNLLLTGGNDYSHFQSLCEFGPVKDGVLSGSQYVTEAASDTQSNFRKAWNTALTSYSETSKYAALFSELAFVKSGTQTMMQNIVWREGVAGGNSPKDANRVGGFSYKFSDEGDGFFSFIPVSDCPYAFVPDNSKAVTEQGMKTGEIVEILGAASNARDLDNIRSFWASGSFFLDWGETKEFDGTDYTEILLYKDSGLHEDVFRFNTANFSASDYNPEAQSGSTTWTLYVGEGTTDKYVLEELSTGGYYLRLNQSLAGKTVRISKSSGGYPAYIPDGNGSFKTVNSASDGTYTVPTANKWANKCAVSFSVGNRICIVKDICVLSDTCFPCGDEIKLDGVSDWSDRGSYSYFKGNYFVPNNTLSEPHIYRCDVTFKSGGREGFKIPYTNSFTNGGYNSKTMGADPKDTWTDAVVEAGDSSKGANDYKWKPNVDGDYTIEFDLSAMKLRVVKR